jgi:hypothetical protein
MPTHTAQSKASPTTPYVADDGRGWTAVTRASGNGGRSGVRHGVWARASGEESVPYPRRPGEVASCLERNASWSAGAEGIVAEARDRLVDAVTAYGGRRLAGLGSLREPPPDRQGRGRRQHPQKSASGLAHHHEGAAARTPDTDQARKNARAGRQAARAGSAGARQ